MKRIALPLLAAAAIALSGCAAITAQNPGGKLTPVNAHVIEGKPSVMLSGQCGGLFHAEQACDG